MQLRAREWLQFILQGVPITSETMKSALRQGYSDACEYGLGGWNPDTGEWWALELTPELKTWRIAALEMLAAWITYDMIAKGEALTMVQLHIDNANVVNNINKLRAKSWSIDHIYQAMQRQMQREKIFFCASWIGTHQNRSVHRTVSRK